MKIQDIEKQLNYFKDKVKCLPANEAQLITSYKERIELLESYLRDKEELLELKGLIDGFAPTRAKIQAALKNQPSTITSEEAAAQIALFKKEREKTL